MRATTTGSGRHSHAAVPELTVDRCWTACVRPRKCSGIAHGNVTSGEVCRCGATRGVESNAGRFTVGPWQLPEARS